MYHNTLSFLNGRNYFVQFEFINVHYIIPDGKDFPNLVIGSIYDHVFRMV